MTRKNRIEHNKLAQQCYETITDISEDIMAFLFVVSTKYGYTSAIIKCPNYEDDPTDPQPHFKKREYLDALEKRATDIFIRMSESK